MPTFTADLARYGPDQAVALTVDAAQAYCRRLAARHYENFAVANWLIPRALRQHFYPIYAYCRWADDLADETGEPARSLELLDWWEAELRACYAGEVRHPVFIALRDTIEQFAIPPEPFLDLLTAFRQDQRQTRYDTLDDLLGYCRNSANPVGRLVLYLGRCSTADRVALSDSICTGLQLANFCQDVARDFERGRIYLPKSAWREAGYDEAQFAAHAEHDSFRQLLKREVDRAEEFLLAGRPLVALMPRELMLQIDLFIGGGLAILANIRAQNYNVWSRRPVVSKWDKFRLLIGCWWRQRFVPRCEVSS